MQAFSARTAQGIQGYAAIVLVAAAPLFLTSCWNSQYRSTIGVPSGTVTITPPTDSSGNNFKFQIGSAVTLTEAPSDVAVIGDGSDTLGDVCQGLTAKNKTGGGYEATTCVCVFKYSINSITTEIEEETSYHESNLIRCSKANVPQEADSVMVRVKNKQTGDYSNEVLFASGNALFSGNFSPTEANSFAKVIRHQVKEVITIPYMFDPNFADPLQSNNSRYNYPFNFYTTDPGRTMLLIMNESIQNPQLVRHEYELQSTTAPTWLNPYIYRRAPDANGSYKISPAAGSAFDSETFYLAKARGGVFTVPINAYIGPDLRGSAAPGASIPPIGYAAQVRIDANRMTSCPNVQIPSNYEWVTVFALRGTFPERKYVKQLGDIKLVNGVMCNPGNYDGSTTLLANKNQAVYRDCLEYNGATYSQTRNLFALTGGGLAARVLGKSEICVKQAEVAGVGGSLLGAGNVNRAGQARIAAGGTYPAGSDLWERVGAEDEEAGYGFVQRIFNLFPGEYQTNNDGGTDSFRGSQAATGAGLNTNEDDQSTPFTSYTNFEYGSDLDSGQSRYNYLFVVVPTGVNIDAFENQTNGTAMYYPDTWPRREDCDNAASPDAAADCVANRKWKVNWDLHRTEIGRDPATAPEKIYPVCAIRPKS